MNDINYSAGNQSKISLSVTLFLFCPIYFQNSDTHSIKLITITPNTTEADGVYLSKFLFSDSVVQSDVRYIGCYFDIRTPNPGTIFERGPAHSAQECMRECMLGLYKYAAIRVSTDTGICLGSSFLSLY